MTDVTHFVCFRWGSVYPEMYVERLYKSVSKYFSKPMRFHCFTDRALDLKYDGIEQHMLVLGQPFYGNWNKERIFASDFLDLPKGTNIVVMDIDVLVTGSLDFVVEEQPEQTLIMAPDGYKNRIGLGHGSVFRHKSGTLPHLWDDLVKEDYEELKKRLRGEREQHWLDLFYPRGKIALFSPGKVVSYKYHCKSKGFAPLGKKMAEYGLSNSVWSKAQLPADARVVCFHGKPDVEDVIHQRYGRWKHAPFIQETLDQLN